MRILCYTDNHFSEKSSIVTKYGTKYTVRLENQIKSINWAEQLAVAKNCDTVVCLGDFFDHAQLTDQELTALRDIQWAEDLEHFFLVGNHESGENDLQYSSTMALSRPGWHIVNEPCVRYAGDLELAFLPYVVESNKKPLEEYFNSKTSKRIIFSHNDLLGIQLGPVVSKTGFDPAELEASCDFCVNGHLHNGTKVTEKVINLGNLSGKDFGEDAAKYSHNIMIIDTSSAGGITYELIENPYAFNFYKLDIEDEADTSKLTTLKSNAVVSVKCKASLVPTVRQMLETSPEIIDSRVIITRDLTEMTEDDVDISVLLVDQCAKFAECCRAKIDNNAILEAELAEILK
jgi:DNA repair exonuclease SbcCD nuclease subunit